MRLAYKDDWDETQERFRLWWKHEYFGRCALAVYAAKENPPAMAPPPPPRSAQQKWYDLDWISRSTDY